MQAAQALPDKLVVKMPLESAQMLSTAHRVLDGDELADSLRLYKATHINHPSSKWVRESQYNYLWLYAHFQALSKEYYHRYGKIHLSWEKLGGALRKPPFSIHLTPAGTHPPLCMPEEYKGGDPVQSYRAYLHSKEYAAWKLGNTPKWW